MTESNVYEFLLNKQYDYPKLNDEAATILAKDFANIIYNTVKVKSSNATKKREQILKFLQTLRHTNKQKHVSIDEYNYTTCLDLIKTDYNSLNHQWNTFLKDAQCDLEIIKPCLSDEIKDFYSRRNKKCMNKFNVREKMRKQNQEMLEIAEFPYKIVENQRFYETTQKVLQRLLVNHTKEHSNVDQTIEFREKQIKYAYALVNFSEWDHLKHVLDALTTDLLPVEHNFLKYLSTFNNVEVIQALLIDKFMFVYEAYLIEIAMKLVKLEYSQATQFLNELESDHKFLQIKKFCNNHLLLNKKLRNFLIQLYIYSFANLALLKLYEILFK